MPKKTIPFYQTSKIQGDRSIKKHYKTYGKNLTMNVSLGRGYKPTRYLGRYMKAASTKLQKQSGGFKIPSRQLAKPHRAWRELTVVLNLSANLS